MIDDRWLIAYYRRTRPRGAVAQIERQFDHYPPGANQAIDKVRELFTAEMLRPEWTPSASV